MKKTPSLIAQLYAAALKAPDGIINSLNKYSRAMLKDARKKTTTPADLEAMRAAQAKRDRRAARRAGRSA